MGPQSCDSSTFAPTDVPVGYSRAFSVEISSVNAGALEQLSTIRRITGAPKRPVTRMH